MTTKEVVNKLALELSFRTGRLEDIKVYKEYLNMALMVGVEHFTNEKEEIIAMDSQGYEIGRYKSICEAEEKLGVSRSNIGHVLAKRQRTAGGLYFIRSVDMELVLADEQ